MSKICKVRQLKIPCNPLGKGYFWPKIVPIIPETSILGAMRKESGGGSDSQKYPYNHRNFYSSKLIIHRGGIVCHTVTEWYLPILCLDSSPLVA